MITTLAQIPYTCILGSILLVVVAVVYSYRRSRTAASPSKSFVSNVEKLQDEHQVAKSFHEAIHSVGGGTWPPRARHVSSWPLALLPYHDIYVNMAKVLAVAKSDLQDNDEVNLQRITLFRERMAEHLHSSIDVSSVEQVLARVEANGNNADFPADAYNGFYACIAMARHAFRWGMIPVVKVAQQQKIIEFPAELCMPWGYLSRRYGVSSMGGNVMSNYLFNLDAQGNVVYEINSAMEPKIKNAEARFTQIFHDLEQQSLPVYSSMIQAFVSFDRQDFSSCVHALRSINQHIRLPLQIFYDSLTEARISRDVWLPYVQGFQGWASGEMIDGQYVESDGLSGNQLCFFHVVDAFLGLEPYLSKEGTVRYIPIGQRQLTDAVREHCFRAKAEKLRLVEIQTELDAIAKHMRVFRAAHKTRAIPYLKTEAPERLVMTAGKSVLGGGAVDKLEEVIKALTAMLDKRFRETK